MPMRKGKGFGFRTFVGRFQADHGSEGVKENNIGGVLPPAEGSKLVVVGSDEQNICMYFKQMRK